jgi:tetraacyldisaccharide 4'-kinase
VSVGNLTVGGSEKTPLVMEILAFLAGRGTRAALVSRGYKGRWEQSGGTLSDGNRLLGGWRESGDEPYMIASRFPRAGVYLGKHRYSSCLAAAADIVIHDPASRAPFREGFSALRRADVLLLKHPEASSVAAIRKRFPRLAVFEYAVEVKGLTSLAGGELLPTDTLRGRSISAFCGIARPHRFFETLESLGLGPEIRTAFPDHFDYPESALARLAAEGAAGPSDAFVTTEKDAVKLRGRNGGLEPVPVYVLRIGLALPTGLFAAIEGLIRSRKGGAGV